MSDDDDGDLVEVCIYHCGDKGGEEIPETVEKLIVEEGVEVVANELCWNYPHLQEVTLQNGLIKIGNRAFRGCRSLLEINICNTVQYIGKEAFWYCQLLRKVQFEFSTTSPHQLQTIDKEAFRHCISLQRIELPSSMNSLGRAAFHSCSTLMEANLSTTAITKMNVGGFQNCRSLQTVSLPNTLERICIYAFAECCELMTVVVPLDSRPITLGPRSFHSCSKLANLLVPKDSTAEESSFTRCGLLNDLYGECSSHILAALVRRFENYPIHRMCYYHHSASITVQELQQCIADQQEEISLVDEFGMTPFHLLFSTAEPSLELLDILLDLLPNHLLSWKDANGRRPMDYLINNWADRTSSLVQRALQKSMIDPLARWGAGSWVETMQSMVQGILVESDKRRRATLCDKAYSLFEQYGNVEATSLLEMALWKDKLEFGSTSMDGVMRKALVDREDYRCLSGSSVVIPHVATFLGIHRRASPEGN